MMDGWMSLGMWADARVVLNTRNLRVCGYTLPPSVREKVVILEYSIVYAVSRTCMTP